MARRKNAVRNAAIPGPVPETGLVSADKPAPAPDRDMAGWVVFGCACAVSIVFMAASAVRATAWTDAGTLWRDVTDKLYERRVFDPSRPGTEAPRTDRARPYNNIGLYLYDQGREMLQARYLGVWYRQNGEDAKTAAEIEKVETLTARIIASIPAEFRSRLVEQTAQSLNRPVPEIAAGSDGLPSRSAFESAMSEMMSASWAWDPFVAAHLCLARAIDHSPTYPIARLNMGLVCKLQDDLEGAETHFRLAHTFDRSYEKAYRYHAQILFEMKDYDDGLQQARRAFELSKSADAALVAGKCAMGLGKDALAEQWLAIAARLGGDEAETWYHRGLLALRRNSPDEALPMLERAAAAQPDSKSITRAIVDIHRKAGRLAEAEKACRRLLSVTSGDEEAHVDLAELYATDFHASDKALAVAEAGLKRFPKSPALHLVAGYANAILKNAAAAEAHYRAAVTADPAYHQAWFQLAHLMQRRDPAQARIWIKRALELKPDNAVYRALERTLSGGADAPADSGATGSAEGKGPVYGPSGR